MSHLLDNLHEFQIDVGQDAKWTEEDLAARRNYVQMQVEWLEHRDLEERMKAARRLTYLVQGELPARTAISAAKLIPCLSQGTLRNVPVQITNYTGSSRTRHSFGRPMGCRLLSWH